MNIKKVLSASALVFLSSMQAFCTDHGAAASGDVELIRQTPVSVEAQNALNVSDEGVFPFMELPKDLRTKIYACYLNASNLRKLSLASKSFGDDIRSAAQINSTIQSRINDLVLTPDIFCKRERVQKLIGSLRNPLGLVSGVSLFGYSIPNASKPEKLGRDELGVLLNSDHIKSVVLCNYLVHPDNLHYCLARAIKHGRLENLSLFGLRYFDERASHDLPESVTAKPLITLNILHLLSVNDKLKAIRIAGCDVSSDFVYASSEVRSLNFPNPWRGYCAALEALGNYPNTAKEFLKLCFSEFINSYKKGVVSLEEGKAINYKDLVQQVMLQIDYMEQNGYITNRSDLELSRVICRHILGCLNENIELCNEELRQIYEQDSTVITVSCKMLRLHKDFTLILKNGMLSRDLKMQLSNATGNSEYRLIFAGRVFYDSKFFINEENGRVRLAKDLRLYDGCTVHLVLSVRG